MPVVQKNATLASVAIFSSGSTASVANNANAISPAIDPTSTAWGGYQRARFVFSGTFGAAPAVNGAITLFFQLPVDGTLSGTPATWETDLGRTTNPVAHLAATIALDNANAPQSRASAPIEIPAVPYRVIAVNSATGQAIAAGWSLSAVPITDQGV